MAPFTETPIFSSKRRSPFQVSKEPDLLDGWWTSDYVFSLERRAIFSKVWVCISHRSRFTKPGDYISTKLAGFPILVILGKDHIVRAFHNVCRHRAYTVAKKEAGSSLILGCRYHGWSYDTKGNLVKAPQFDGIEGFNKAENSLFQIRACKDRAGFIHINLDAAGHLEHAPDCDDTVRFSAEHGISTDSTWLMGWYVDSGFNWKTAGANDRTGIGTNLPTANTTNMVDSIFSLFRRPRLDLGSTQTLQLTPITTVLVFPKSPIWVMLTTLPVSIEKCAIRCDVFSTTKEALDRRDEQFLRALLDSRVQDLEERYSALKGSTPTEDSSVLPLLKAHLKLERLAGTKIFPERRDDSRSTSFCRAEKVCRELDLMAKAEKSMDMVRVDSLRGDMEW
ncbi:ISP domain-containing protein [Pleomassaria siparia CBS 279.74]|uniref:ISP domain-containing protein n=1 Tax=Pleomassaria siparia CBS 279.74 TaxID=1314801 RepID=A0A6G1K8M9_9PLEO|nr:ISP domain-containing protein [Pleomassaria siparia CBS 279.74]